MNKKYFLQTNRLFFRRWNEDDYPLAKELWGDLKVTKLFDRKGILSEKDVKEKLLSEIENDIKFGVQYWPIFNLESGEFIGACGLRTYNIREGIYEIGFHICSKNWGEGYATEAVKGVVKYAFDHLKVKGLFAGHNPKNIASKILLIKLGFEYTHDEFYEPTKLMHPSYLLTK